MTKIAPGPSLLALVTDRTGPALWRVLQPITALEKLGYPCGWDHKDNGAVSTIASAFDAYLLPRIYWKAGERNVAKLWFNHVRRAGKIVIWECDDDLFTPEFTRRERELDGDDGLSFEQLELERLERIWTVQQCDGVTVSTQRLATVVRQFTSKPVIVVPNAIDLPWFQGIARGAERVVESLTIGWVGGRRLDEDVESMARAWGRVARAFPHVRFIVMGWDPPIIHEHVPSEQLVVLPWMPLEHYPVGFAQVDIGCCAVADTQFNKAKSPIKAMEYAAAGAAVVASPTLYSTIIDHHQDGFIATTVDEWEHWLTVLVQSPALRSIMATRLLKKIKKYHALSVNAWRWPTAWTQIVLASQSQVWTPEMVGAGS